MTVIFFFFVLAMIAVAVVGVGWVIGQFDYKKSAAVQNLSRVEAERDRNIKALSAARRTLSQIANGNATEIELEARKTLADVDNILFQ